MSATVDQSALLQSVTAMTKARKLKLHYRSLPIADTDPRYAEPLMPINDYGLAGQSYYSRPNLVTKTPVAGAPVTILLRESIVETLIAINNRLRNPRVTAFFGDEVELYVEEGLRPVALQIALYNDYIPALLRTQYPGESKDSLQERLANIIAFPSTDAASPPPHATGGAFDITLRFRQPTLQYVANCNVTLGTDADLSDAIQPDYYELNQPKNDYERLIQRNRRAFYAIMRGSAFALDTQFVCNPTEWWHWGRGDQLSETIKENTAAYYAAVSQA